MVFIKPLISVIITFSWRLQHDNDDDDDDDDDDWKHFLF